MELADRIKLWRGEESGKETETFVDLLIDSEDRIRALERALEWMVTERGCYNCTDLEPEEQEALGGYCIECEGTGTEYPGVGQCRHLARRVLHGGCDNPTGPDDCPTCAALLGTDEPQPEETTT